jgi:IS30 family transposase
MISEEELALVEYKLNTRPRKRLNYLTPLEAFSVALAG